MMEHSLDEQRAMIAARHENIRALMRKRRGAPAAKRISELRLRVHLARVSYDVARIFDRADADDRWIDLARALSAYNERRRELGLSPSEAQTLPRKDG